MLLKIELNKCRNTIKWHSGTYDYLGQKEGERRQNLTGKARKG